MKKSVRKIVSNCFAFFLSEKQESFLFQVEDLRQENVECWQGFKLLIA